VFEPEEHYKPVRTTTVVTLRDLRDEHPREVRRLPLYPNDGRPYEARDLCWTADLIGLALLAVEWRGFGSDRVQDQDLRDFLRRVALWIGGADQPHVYVPIVGADLVLSVTREPEQ
jgi:hypothetical protein